MTPTHFVLVVTLLVTAAPAQRSGSSMATSRILDAIGVREGLTVCEIGAGDGELSIEAARVAGPSGRVYTSELGEERVKALRERVAESRLPQVTVIEGAAAQTNFPAGACGAVFMRNVYHHFADPAGMNVSILAAMRPGARLAVVDFTPPGDEAPAPADRGKDGMHGVKPETVARELTAAGFEAVASEDGGDRWFMVVVARPGAK